MTLTAKSAHDLERQKLFEMLRHYFSSQHQVPCYLTYEAMKDLLCFLGEWKE